MDEKRKLKKLVLKKEEIVNLNDYQMRQAIGGSSRVCTYVSKISQISFDYFFSEIIDDAWNDVNNYMMEKSIRTCKPEISEEVVTGGCLLPEVVIRP